VAVGPRRSGGFDEAAWLTDLGNPNLPVRSAAREAGPVPRSGFVQAPARLGRR
jgi:hypothetical protein